MSANDIDAALIAAYQASGLGLPTAYDGEEFTPPANGSAWARVTQLPSGNEIRSLGVGGMDRQQGILQIDFSTELGSGRATLLGYVQAMFDQFVGGQSFTSGGQAVRIRIAERSNIREADGYQRVTVSVYWEANTIRPAI
jgi:hypothetical protein